MIRKVPAVVAVVVDDAVTGSYRNTTLKDATAPRRGRPAVGDGPGTVVPVRLDEATIVALTQKAKAEGIATRSEAIRAAVRQWTNVA